MSQRDVCSLAIPKFGISRTALPLQLFLFDMLQVKGGCCGLWRGREERTEKEEENEI
jgi:hypothetical protein